MKGILAGCYLLAGIFVAYTHAYLSFHDVDNVISAITAVIAWPLVLADWNLHLGALASIARS